MQKNILITGVSSGLGNALATTYSSEGHRVFGCGRRKGVNIKGVEYSSVDLTDSHQVEDWLSTVFEQVENIDVCINCAGTLQSGKKLWEFDNEESKSMIDINVISTLNLIRQVIPAMKNNNRGKFTTMASNPHGYPLSGLGLYAICKTSIEKIIEVLGEELPSHITCVALYPGLVNTPMLQRSIGVESAGNYHDPEIWAKQASDALLNLDEKYHGLHVALEDMLNN